MFPSIEQDPSITQATGKTTNGLEDYNPFANQTTKPTTVS